METDDEEGGHTHLLLAAVLILVTACNTPQKPIPPPVTAIKKDSTPAALTKPPGKARKKVYLTFDDGPNTGTGTVMRIVTAENAPAAFFVVAEHINGTGWQRSLWDSLRRNTAFELYNHSYSHALHNRFERFYNRPDTVWSDFFRARDTLCLRHNICRTPGRNAWRLNGINSTDIQGSKPAIDSAAAAGLYFVGWDLQWHYEAPNLLLSYGADSLMRQIDSAFKKGRTAVPDNLVLLAHDQTFQDHRDSASLVQLIHLIRSNPDYELKPLSQYPPVRQALGQ